MASAQYSLATGIISAVVNPSLTNPEQIAALQAQGIGILEVPVGTNGASSMVDLTTTTLVSIVQNPPIPHLFSQYVAAQINNGTLNPLAFHPATLAALNSSLTAASMAPVTASAQPVSTAGTAASTAN